MTFLDPLPTVKGELSYHTGTFFNWSIQMLHSTSPKVFSNFRSFAADPIWRRLVRVLNRAHRNPRWAPRRRNNAPGRVRLLSRLSESMLRGMTREVAESLVQSPIHPHCFCGALSSLGYNLE